MTPALQLLTKEQCLPNMLRKGLATSGLRVPSPVEKAEQAWTTHLMCSETALPTSGFSMPSDRYHPRYCSTCFRPHKAITGFRMRATDSGACSNSERLYCSVNLSSNQVQHAGRAVMPG